MSLGTPSTVRPSPRPATVRDWRWPHLVGLAALSAYSTAIGWQAQLVSYPLFRAVAPDDFLAYHAQYNRAIPLVVVVPGFVCFLACAAFPWTRPPHVSRRLATVVAAGGVVSLVATVAWAIPRHDLLDRIGRSATVIDSLLDANLLRTLALTAGTIALLVATTRAGRRAG
ncbi:hypothetical protein [Actinomycetospora straminea]|uniref:DUF1772 domain-containing protein n=1 Tax=Actinomycetospora straminea TaxID=663607 RepID=A0ABP9DTI5_9PSEU|nr:hypothetical protein [Actinomycetospora straminea]MDD7935912.1 hypothetical protein [Actinomycetospora straminea]